MTLVTLADVLRPAQRQGYAVAGVVCLGWEDMRAYVDAAEAELAPIILQAGPGCRAHTPLPVLAAMFRCLGEGASVPVVAHLDHGYTAEECRQALDLGFTSVMFDGSRHPLQQNIDETAQIATMAHAAGASCEGEIGYVGYAGAQASVGTDPVEAALFASQTGIDAMAISAGNTHLQKRPDTGLDLNLISAIRSATDIPLVLHGGSGIPADERSVLAKRGLVSKFNIGTELRMTFGAALRAALASDPDRFDRNELLTDTMAPVTAATRAVIRSLGFRAG